MLNLRFILYISLAFPFIGIMQGTDLQPIYFILLVLMVIYSTLNNQYKISKSMFLLFCMALIVIIYRLRFNYSGLDLAKAIPIYITPVLILLLFQRKNNKLFNELLVTLKISLYIYVSYGLLQYLDFGFLDWMIEQRPRIGRGVNSLCPEPSMFGFTILLIFISLIASAKYKFRDFVVFIFGMWLSGATSVILATIPIVMAITYYDTKRTSIFMIFLVAISAIFSLNLVTERSSEILTQESLISLISDASINERFGHLYFVLTDIRHILFGGRNGWGSSYIDFINNSNIFYHGSTSNNILSGIGNLIFDGGILAIIYLYLYFKYSLHNVKINLPVILIISSWLFVAFQSVSFAVPLLTIAILSFQKSVR